MAKEKDSPSDIVETAQAQFTEAQKKVGDAAVQAQNEFLKAFQEMGQEAASCAAAELERSRKLSEKLTAARSFPDAMTAYQEWLREEMAARTGDAQKFMTNSQKFMHSSRRLFSSGWSSVGVPRVL